MPQPQVRIEDIGFENLILDPEVEKQVEAQLIVDNIKSQQKADDTPPEKIENAEDVVVAPVEPKVEKQQEKPAEEIEDENPITTMILQAAGVEIDGDFDDTAEGINKLISAVVPKLAQSQVEEILGVNPLVKDFAEYVSNGGDPVTFLQVQYPQVDYTQMTLSPEDASQHESVVRTWLAKQGLQSEKIDAAIKTYKDTNLMYAQAEMGLDYLSKTQKAEQQGILEQQAKIKESQDKEIAETWKAIKSKVADGRVGEATIPMAERSVFLEYISKPVDKQGNTQADLDAAQADLDMNLLMDYLRFKKLNLASLIDGGVKTKMASDKQAKLKIREKTSGDAVRAQTVKNPVSALDGFNSAADFIKEQ
jgi:hypothetical protein